MLHYIGGLTRARQVFIKDLNLAEARTNINNTSLSLYLFFFSFFKGATFLTTRYSSESAQQKKNTEQNFLRVNDTLFQQQTRALIYLSHLTFLINFCCQHKKWRRKHFARRRRQTTNTNSFTRVREILPEIGRDMRDVEKENWLKIQFCPIYIFFFFLLACCCSSDPSLPQASWFALGFIKN